MDNSRFSKRNPWSKGSRILATDSVILSEDEVARALVGDEKDARHGDVIDGVRNGLIMSAGLWAMLICLGLYFFR